MKLKAILLGLICLVCIDPYDSPVIASDNSGLSKPPNIILVMTDDQGYGDLSCHGHPFLKTPNLDRLHEESTRFVDFHVSPTCAPTRAALMSGLAPFKNGVTHTILERDRMALTSTTVAEVLKSAGYTTGIFGKWHLGDDDPYQPNNRGFDETFIHGAGGIGQKYPGSQSDALETGYFDPIIKHNGQFVKTEGFCTDVFFQQALGWIKQQSDKGDDGRPFFAYIPTNAPHSPYIVAEKYAKPFTEKTGEKDDAFFGMIVNIDENVGVLMEKLDQWELSNNTLLIFMTDNGSAAGSKLFNAGMRGGKGTVNEGGCRVPLFMRLPGVTKAGLDIETMARHYDIFPTLVEMAGSELPSDLKLDGRSLMPLIKDPKADWPDRYFFFHTGRWAKGGIEGRWAKGDPDPDNSKYRSFAVRDERWRVVNKRLYDLKNDPAETTDVAAEHPEIASKMISEFDKWWAEVRPMMVNEDASLDVPKPFRVQFRKQKESEGIPNWKKPDFLIE
jgi:arylsulfatase